MRQQVTRNTKQRQDSDVFNKPKLTGPSELKYFMSRSVLSGCLSEQRALPERKKEENPRDRCACLRSLNDTNSAKEVSGLLP